MKHIDPSNLKKVTQEGGWVRYEQAELSWSKLVCVGQESSEFGGGGSWPFWLQDTPSIIGSFAQPTHNQMERVNGAQKLDAKTSACLTRTS